MLTALLVGLGGAAGALLRFGIGLAAGPDAVPWATLGINVVGAMLLGVLLGAGAGRLPDPVVTGLGVGVLGGFTTFSAFAVEVVALLDGDRADVGLAYVAASVLLGTAAAAAGLHLGRTAA